MQEKDVFISYNSKEAEEANWVKSVLENNGISCWMAPACIPGGSNYASEIPKAIKNSKIFVLILSAKAQDSMWVTKEVDRAINEGKIILPFMLENCALRDDFNFYLTNVQRYAAYENKVAAARKMVNEIKALIEGSKDEDESLPLAENNAEPEKEITVKAENEQTSAKKTKKFAFAKKTEKSDEVSSLPKEDAIVIKHDMLVKACFITGIISVFLFFLFVGLVPMILSVFILNKMKKTGNVQGKKQTLIGGILGLVSFCVILCIFDPILFSFVSVCIVVVYAIVVAKILKKLK